MIIFKGKTDVNGKIQAKELDGNNTSIRDCLVGLSSWTLYIVSDTENNRQAIMARYHAMLAEVATPVLKSLGYDVIPPSGNGLTSKDCEPIIRKIVFDNLKKCEDFNGWVEISNGKKTHLAAKSLSALKSKDLKIFMDEAFRIIEAMSKINR